MIRNKHIGNGILLLVSVCFALLLCEFIARMMLNPADFLEVQLAEDKVLGVAPTKYGAGTLDKWGFRNREVPEQADIVAIGDSHTYGFAAAMEDSWPSALSRLSGQKVYNMALGGYGPNQYFYLLSTKALQLKPKIILCGLWMGDDFENAYKITYGLEHWSYLRKLPPQEVNFDTWVRPENPDLQKRIRIWLSEHSLTYQLLFHFSPLVRLKGYVKPKNSPQLGDTVVPLIVPEHHIKEAILPYFSLINLNQDSKGVLEGMRITFELLRQMNEISRQNHIAFIVVVIPLKERVLSEYLAQDPKLPLRDVIDKVLENEAVAREKTIARLNELGIPYVDPLPAMKRAAEQHLYAETGDDVHPGRNGYRVIAEAVSDWMKRGGASIQQTSSSQ
jgi:lysophospholipase L1-like esterase